MKVIGKKFGYPDPGSYIYRVRLIKIKVMTVKERIQALEVDEVFEFVYGKNYKGEDRVFTFSCYDEYKGEKSYSVRAGNIFESMNVEKITDKYISLYTFDMMGQRSTYKLPIAEMKVGNVFEEVPHDLKWDVDTK